MKFQLFVLSSLTITLFFHLNANAASRDINPGTYEDWGRRINKLEIIKSFKLADYPQLLIPDIDTSNIQFQINENLVPEDDKIGLIKQGKHIFINRIKDNSQNIKVIETSNDNNKSLILKISIVQVGVQKKTIWWYPLSWVEIQGEIIDSQNYEVLLKFITRRTSSVKELEKETVVKSIKNDFHELGGDLIELILSFR
jgi:hypothetical protein